MADPRLVAAIRERAGKRLRRKVRIRVKAARFPKAVELRYIRDLRDYARAGADAIRRSILPILDRDGDGAVKGVPLTDLTRAVEKSRLALEELALSAGRKAGAMIVAVEKASRDAQNAQVKEALGVEPYRAPSLQGIRRDAPGPVEQVLQERLKDNVDLIRSISTDMLGQVQDMLREEFPKGLRVEDLAKKLEERFGVAESRAKLIARDQVGKLNAQLSESRNRALGVSRYVWQTSGDERVRGNPEGLWPKGMHYDLNGQTFSYDDPPVTNDAGDKNNPGEDYQCRCNAIPVLEDVLESLGI